MANCLCIACGAIYQDLAREDEAPQCPFCKRGHFVETEKGRRGPKRPLPALTISEPEMDEFWTLYLKVVTQLDDTAPDTYKAHELALRTAAHGEANILLLKRWLLNAEQPIPELYEYMAQEPSSEGPSRLYHIITSLVDRWAETTPAGQGGMSLFEAVDISECGKTHPQYHSIRRQLSKFRTRVRKEGFE
jgi:hypothetical protein